MLTTPLGSGSETEEISDYSQYNDADEVQPRKRMLVFTFKLAEKTGPWSRSRVIVLCRQQLVYFSKHFYAVSRRLSSFSSVKD